MSRSPALANALLSSLDDVEELAERLTQEVKDRWPDGARRVLAAIPEHAVEAGELARALRLSVEDA